MREVFLPYWKRRRKRVFLCLSLKSVRITGVGTWNLSLKKRTHIGDKPSKATIEYLLSWSEKIINFNRRKILFFPCDFSNAAFKYYVFLFLANLLTAFSEFSSPPFPGLESTKYIHSIRTRRRRRTAPDSDSSSCSSSSFALRGENPYPDGGEEEDGTGVIYGGRERQQHLNCGWEHPFRKWTRFVDRARISTKESFICILFCIFACLIISPL